MSNEPALLTNRCQLPSGSLWFGRAHLYEDRIDVSGWKFWGRYQRTIALERVQEVEWRAVIDDINLILHLDNEKIVRLQLLKNAGTWNVKLHDLLDQSVLSEHISSSLEGRPADFVEEKAGSQKAPS